MNPNLVSTFEIKRLEVWRANRGLLLVCAASFAALLSVTPGNVPVAIFWVVASLTAIVTATTVARLVGGLTMLYRCPGCGTIPYRVLEEYKCGGLGPARASFMSPSACPQCGTRIR